MPLFVQEYEEQLKKDYERFRNNPYQRFILKVRQVRRKQLCYLLSLPPDPTTFEYEVWNFESKTKLRGYNVELQLFDKVNEQSLLKNFLDEHKLSLEGLEQALAAGYLELHGNYIWGQGTGRFLKDKRSTTHKQEQLNDLVRLLNRAQLSPLEKITEIERITGFEEYIQTGLVMIFHPQEIGQVNPVLREVLAQWLVDRSYLRSLRNVQFALTSLKTLLGIADFLELDWFLYQYIRKVQEADQTVRLTDVTILDISTNDKQIWLDSFRHVLLSANEPLHPREILQRAIANGLPIKSGTNTHNALLTVFDMLGKYPHVFVEVSGGKYALLHPTLPVDAAMENILASLHEQGILIDERTLRRYYLSLQTHNLVLLDGPGGSGKTWLTAAYAKAVGAIYLHVTITSHWSHDEDLLGYPDTQQIDGYRHTPTSTFLLQAAADYEQATTQKRHPRHYHLVLDGINKAPVTKYAAKILDALETRARSGSASISLAENLDVSLYTNVSLIGTTTANTSYPLTDQVYDYSQYIELPVTAMALWEFIGDTPYRELLVLIWSDLHEAAPFAYRAVHEMQTYIADAEKAGVPWQEAFDEQILQKILPKCHGPEQKLHSALQKVLQIVQADLFPLSYDKIQKVLANSIE